MADQDPSPERLGGWKAIASYLNRSVRTVQRWEADWGLPVRRLQGTGSVLAYSQEIDAWCESDRGREALAETTPPAGLQRTTASSPSSSAQADDRYAALHATSVDEAQAGASTGAPRRARRGFGPVTAVFGLFAIISVVAASSWRWLRAADIALVCPGECAVPQGESLIVRGDGAHATDTFVRSIEAENGRTELFKPALSPDARGTVTWGFTTDCSSTPGLYQLRLVHENSDRVTNAVRVRIRPNPSCATPVADLVAEGVTVDAAVARPAQVVTCRFRLRNQGDVRAPASIARLRLGMSPDRTAVTDRMLADVSAPSISVGETVSLEGVFQVPHGLTPRVPYYVWVVADNGSAVLERVSVNNFARSSVLTVHGKATQ